MCSSALVSKSDLKFAVSQMTVMMMRTFHTCASLPAGIFNDDTQTSCPTKLIQNSPAASG